jgi:hypothetical protein
MVARQNLHFTAFLLWLEETIWLFLHAGHTRLRLRSLRKIVEIKNGFKLLAPLICSGLLALLITYVEFKNSGGIGNWAN